MSGISKCMENIYGQIDSLRSGKSFFFFFFVNKTPYLQRCIREEWACKNT